MRGSIKKRILLVLLVAQGILTAVAATAAIIYTRSQMLSAFDAELHRRMLTTLTMAQTADEKDSGFEFVVQPNAIPKDDIYAIWDNRGALVASSPDSASVLHAQFSTQAIMFFKWHGRMYRGSIWRAVPLLDEEGEGGEGAKPPAVTRLDLAYGIPADAFQARFAGVVALAIFGSCFFLAVSSSIAWFSVSRGLVPLDKLAARASKITERHWDFHTGPDVSEIAELLPLAQALEGLVSRLKGAFERERQFVDDAAHELKTAVAIQKSTLQVVAHGAETISEYRKGFEQALSDVDRLETLVLRMLSLASVEGSASENSFGPVVLGETLLAACEQLAPLAELRGIRIDNESIASLNIWGDSDLLNTLWTALLENAIQHSPKGSVVAVAGTAVDEYRCRVYIRDYGEGISPDALPKVFERFFRADRSRSRQTGGHGLGLAISKAIVERHHGTIAIESKLGKGTTIMVELPRTGAKIKVLS